MLSTQTKGWVGARAPKYTSAMADGTKATDHVTQKTNPPTQAPEVCE